MKLNYNFMRIRCDHAIALSIVRHGHGQQRGMPSIPCQRRAFGQTHLESVVGVVGKLVGGVADQRDALNLPHDKDDDLGGRWVAFYSH